MAFALAGSGVSAGTSAASNSSSKGALIASMVMGGVGVPAAGVPSCGLSGHDVGGGMSIGSAAASGVAGFPDWRRASGGSSEAVARLSG